MPNPTPSELKRLVTTILHSQADLANFSRKHVKEQLIADHDFDEDWFKDGNNKKVFKEAVTEAAESHPCNQDGKDEDKDGEEDEARSGRSSSARATSEKEATPAPENAEEDGSGAGEISEMSSLEDSADESSRRTSKSKIKGTKKRASSGGDGKKAKKSRTSSTSKADAGPNAELEEEIKRLKKYVAACGVRKVWVKLYAAEGCDGTSEADLKGQAKVIRGVLSELGMDGRLSMEKAKQIKEKREFESEVAAMQADASIHVKSGGLRSGRKITRRRGSGESSSEEDEDDAPTITRSVKNSLAAFAADLNDSD